MSVQTQVESREFLQIGFGPMGAKCIDALAAGGVEQGRISIVDLNPKAREWASVKFPNASVGDVLPEEPPEQTFIAVNTAFHLKILEAVAKLGGRAVLCEKPLMLAAQDGPELDTLVGKLPLGFTAYLINFSHAMEVLVEFMARNRLFVIGGSGNWCKNRREDKRPTAGDLEDEMTHLFSAFLVLARQNQEIRSLKVSAKLDFQDYVDVLAQRRLHELEPLVSMKPSSSSSVTLTLKTDKALRDVVIPLRSSYVEVERERRILVRLSADGKRCSHQAVLTFDDHGGEFDTLRIFEGRKEIEKRMFKAKDKFGAQIAAFGAAAVGETAHPMLTPLRTGLELVRMSGLAIRSHALRKLGYSDTVTQSKISL